MYLHQHGVKHQTHTPETERAHNLLYECSCQTHQIHLLIEKKKVKTNDAVPQTFFEEHIHSLYKMSPLPPHDIGLTAPKQLHPRGTKDSM